MGPRPHRAQRLATFAAGLLLVPGLTGAPTAQATPGGRDAADPTRATAPGVYLVTLAGRPTAVNPATRPAPGRRFDRTRPEVAVLARRLRAGQDRVLDSAGDPVVLYRWTTALNGFAAVLDETQVKRLRADDRVRLVERSTVQRPASDTAAFLGLLGADGAWGEAGGPARAGRGVVVGVVDTGIWPENPSFAGLPQQSPGTSPALPGFHGACVAADQWKADDCNDKVVSARWFVSGFGRDRLASTEMLSARDSTGHGSHDASTAAGERRVDVEIDGQGFGTDSGMAPAARIAAYKACWTAPDPADDGCATADTVTAVDRAVADGVDVLSYSVAGSTDPTDTLSRAFLSAASAGVFVATAAGNRDDGAPGVGNAAPWVTTVGASTHALHQGAVVLGDGTSYVGAMASDKEVPPTGIVLAGDAVADGAEPAAAARCETGSLDAAVVADRIVVCERGVTPRAEKSAEVARAGGIAMVLVNTVADTVEPDVHAVPTVHLDVDEATALTAYVRGAGDQATAALDPDGAQEEPLPAIAPFSARGPLPVGGLLKPDLTAPGVAVVGAVAPPSSSGRLWDLRSGTSVSAPHVAGLAAFLRGVHPTWSPARLKSAMMTTADDLQGSAGPFAEGAGQVDPTGFLHPGLVLDTTPAAWRRYLSGDLRAQDLNLASLSVGRLVGQATVVRRLTNVGATTETYTASATGLDGIDVRVSPASVTLRPGQTGAVRIRLVATPSAPVSDYARGHLTWTGGRHEARIPVVVRTESVAAPEEVSSQVDTGRVEVEGRTGTGRRVRAATVGLAAADPVGLSLRPGSFDPGTPSSDADTFSTTLEVPDGSEAARFEVVSHNAGDDLDVYVFRAGVLVDAATGSAPGATVTLLDPTPGDYTVYVHAAAVGNGAASTGELSTWVVGRHDRTGRDLRVKTEQPATRPGAPFRSTVSWGSLDPTQRWFGIVRYARSDRRTLLRIG